MLPTFKTKIQAPEDNYYFDLFVAPSVVEMYRIYTSECRFITKPIPLYKTVDNAPGASGGMFLYTYRNKYKLGKMFLCQDYLWTNTVIHECCHASDARMRKLVDKNATKDYRESLSYGVEIYTTLVREYLKSNQIINYATYTSRHRIPREY